MKEKKAICTQDVFSQLNFFDLSASLKNVNEKLQMGRLGQGWLEFGNVDDINPSNNTWIYKWFNMSIRHMYDINLENNVLLGVSGILGLESMCKVGKIEIITGYADIKSSNPYPYENVSLLMAKRFDVDGVLLPRFCIHIFANEQGGSIRYTRRNKVGAPFYLKDADFLTQHFPDNIFFKEKK